METKPVGKHSDIFSNKFTLKYNNSQIEQSLNDSIKGKKAYIIVYGIANTVLIVVGLMIASLNKDEKFSLAKESILYFGILAFCVNIVDAILFFLSLKFERVTDAFLYLNFFIVVLSSNYVVTYLYQVLIDQKATTLFPIYSFQFLYVSNYVLFIDNDFVKIFVDFVILLIIMILALTINRPINDIIANVVSLTTGFICFVVILYFWCKFFRSYFYFKEKCSIQKNFFFEILDSLKSGVLVYDTDHMRIKFINKSLKSHDQFLDITETFSNNNITIKITSKKSTELPLLSNILDDNQLRNRVFRRESVSSCQDSLVSNELSEQMNIIDPVNDKIPILDDKTRLKEKLSSFNIFKHLFDINQNIDQNLLNIIETGSFDDIITILAGKIEDNANASNEFVFLGRLYLTQNQNNILYEVYFKTLQANCGNYIQFLLNDVSKTKMIEEEAIKIKTDIMAKISHEFKNPLVVITETSNQIIDNFENRSSSPFDFEKNAEKINFIGNLCQFMVMLVKDFEVISNHENNKEVAILSLPINVPDFLKDIKNMVYALYKRKNSKSVLLFEFLNSLRVTDIISDEIRLKQIVINLLSNSIKFTESGRISLSFEEVNAVNTGNDFDSNTYFVRISISDTGPGMSSIIMSSINAGAAIDFTQKQNNENNKLGTGYGLSIIQKLCKSLGSSMMVKPNSPHGTVFYFDLMQNYENREITYNMLENEIDIHSEDVLNIYQPEVSNDSSLTSQSFHYESNKIEELLNTNRHEIEFAVPGKSLILCEHRHFTQINRRHKSLTNVLSSLHNELIEIPEYNYRKLYHGNPINKFQEEFLDSQRTLNKVFQTQIPISMSKYTIKVPQIQQTSQVQWDDKPEKNNSRKLSTPEIFKKAYKVSRKGLSVIYPKRQKSYETKSKPQIYDCIIAEMKINNIINVEEVKEVKVEKSNLKHRTSDSKVVKRVSFSNINNIKTNDILEEVEGCCTFSDITSSLKTHVLKKTMMGSSAHRVVTIMVCDDEPLIRSAIMRNLKAMLINLQQNIQLRIIEACDGVDCLSCLHTTKGLIKIDAIISDENMPFISGSQCSNIIYNFIERGVIKEVDMYISTGLDGVDITKYSKAVKKILPKPLSKHDIKEIFVRLNIK